MAEERNVAQLLANFKKRIKEQQKEIKELKEDAERREEIA